MSTSLPPTTVAGLSMRIVRRAEQSASPRADRAACIARWLLGEWERSRQDSSLHRDAESCNPLQLPAPGA